MNFDENGMNILEESVLISSNCLEEKTMDGAIDISNLIKKQYDFSIDLPNDQLKVTLQEEAEKENECLMETADFIVDDTNISNIASTLRAPIWIMVNKKTQVNRKTKYVDTQMLDSAKLETTDTMPHLSNKFDSITNDELIKLKSITDMSEHNISTARNLPNILRGPRIFSKSNMSSSFSFDIEDNSSGANNSFENISSQINEREKNKNTTKSHRKRKQVHNPLVIQEDSTNLVIDKKFNYCNKSIEKNKSDSKIAKEFSQNHGKETTCKMKPLLFDKIENKISFSPTSMEETVVQSSSITTNITTCTHEKNEDQINDLNFSSEFDEFYKKQFHEDYIDHFDILTDTLKGYQDLNDSYDHECYDINSNYILNSNSMECSKLLDEESPDYDAGEQNESSWDDTNIIENNYLSDYEDYLKCDDTDFQTFKESKSKHVSSNDYNLGKASIHCLYNKNCLSSFLNDSSNDELCLKNSSYNDPQNSFNKDETRHLNTLSLEEKECKENLENHLNNGPISSNINFELTNNSKNTTSISLSDDLEHPTITRQDESKQQNDECNELLNTDFSINIPSDYLKCMELNNKNLLEENQLPIQKSLQKEIKVLYNHTMELNSEKKDDKHKLQVESNESAITNENLNNINKSKMIIETFQCVLCTLTFTSKRTLALHLAGAHGGMYVILCERCGRLFNKKCLFSRHFIHCGCVKLPFGCQKCNKTYRHKSSLLHHLKIVHQVEHKRDTKKLYKCDMCSKVYRKYGAFEKHLGTHINS